VPFLCECADIECLGRVEATLSEFEVIHEDSERFFVVPGHLRVDGETVVTNKRPLRDRLEADGGLADTR
jgi:hypothetical protein